MSECECLARTPYRSLTPRSKSKDGPAFIALDHSVSANSAKTAVALIYYGSNPRAPTEWSQTVLTIAPLNTLLNAPSVGPRKDTREHAAQLSLQNV